MKDIVAKRVVDDLLNIKSYRQEKAVRLFYCPTFPLPPVTARETIQYPNTTIK